MKQHCRFRGSSRYPYYRRLRLLVPHFCPWHECSLHDPADPKAHAVLRHRSWFTCCGYYRTKVRGVVQRFRCHACKRSFSEQSFRLDYYVKRRLSYRRIEQGLVGCSSVRAMARSLDCTADSILNRISRTIM